MDKKIEKIAIEHLRMTLKRLRDINKQMELGAEFVIDDFDQSVDFVENEILELKKED